MTMAGRNADLDREWHPLDGVPAPDDFVPPAWIAEHVARRLIDGFKTLRNVPAVLGPKMFGTSWPVIGSGGEDEELTAEQRAELEAKGVKVFVVSSASADDPAPSRPPLTIEDVTRMERVIVWPARYLKDEPDLMFAVNDISAAIASGKDIEWFASRAGNTPDVWRARYMAGCALIAVGLIEDRVLVF